MTKRLATICCLALLGLSLGSCTRCGWIWNDWGKACHAEMPK